MELSYFHKLVLLFAFLILGIGVFSSTSERLTSHYTEVSKVSQKYGLISIEPLSDVPKFLSQAWLKNMMVSSLINASTKETPENVQELIVKLDNPSPVDNLYLLSFPAEQSLLKIERDLESLSTVAFVEPNLDISLQSEPLQNTTLPVPAKLSPTSLSATTAATKPSFKVAIIDSGVDKNHPSFSKKKIHTYSYNGDLSDKVGHGTHLAGLILSSAPEAEIYSYKFTDGKTGNLSGVLKAISQAQKDQVNLVNLSLGLQVKSLALQEGIELLRKHNITVVAAAGNQNTNQEFYPAAYPGVISVGALTNNNLKLPNSNYGRWVNFSVDGQEVYSTAPDASFKYLTGTSQAAAILSGLIASFNLEPPRNLTLEQFLKTKKIEVKEDDFKDLLGVRLAL